MATCAYCGQGIFLGGTRQGDFVFCNDRCRQMGSLLSVANQVPEDMVRQYVTTVHSGDCPICHGRGPVDVHTSHRVWSALLLTSWNSQPQICCRSCGVKNKLADMVFCMALGWWGFPWGFIITPVQISRNFFGMFSAPNPDQPSEHLDRLLRLNLAARLLAAQQPQNAEIVD